MIITESVIVFTLMLVSALDAVVAVTMKNHKKQLFECSTVARISILTLGLLIITLPAHELASSTFLMVCIMHLYNTYYAFASEDELIEGIMWPRFRDWFLEKFNHIKID